MGYFGVSSSSKTLLFMAERVTLLYALESGISLCCGRGAHPCRVLESPIELLPQ